MARVATAARTHDRPARRRRGALGLLSAVLVGLGTMAVTAPAASAEVDEGLGHLVQPGQPYQGVDGSGGDWIGSYTVGGKQVFCVQFQFKAPDTDEKYEPGDELLTKWGDRIDDGTAANMSYLLLRYGDTKNPDEAAALAHLLHSWTAAPRTPEDLAPTNDFRTIAYDAPLHLKGLPAAAKDAASRLSADAEANRGPWTAALTAPEGEQFIDVAAPWMVTVTNASGNGVPDVPVTVKLTDATVNGTDGADTAQVRTDAEGKATVQVTPTGKEPKAAAALKAPAARPYVQNPVDTATQRVVSTGGEQDLTAEAATTAKPRAGNVSVAKVDAKTGAGIAGVALRITGKDRAAPANRADGAPLLGADGKPVVVTTEGAAGTTAVPDLAAPQEICVVEVSPPPGYDAGFDPANPPSACGEIRQGETLALRIANAPNEVPRVIPAGTEPTAIAYSGTSSTPSGGALGALGGGALLASLGLGLLARRRFSGN